MNTGISAVYEHICFYHNYHTTVKRKKLKFTYKFDFGDASYYLLQQITFDVGEIFQHGANQSFLILGETIFFATMYHSDNVMQSVKNDIYQLH